MLVLYNWTPAQLDTLVQMLSETSMEVSPWFGPTWHMLVSCRQRRALSGKRMLRYMQACRMAHLDRPYKDWAMTVGSVPADAMRLPQHGRIAPGLPANLVLFKGRGYSELLARPQWDRVGTILTPVQLKLFATSKYAECRVADAKHAIKRSPPIHDAPPLWH